MHILAACPNTISKCNLHEATSGWTPGGAVLGLGALVVIVILVKVIFFRGSGNQKS